MDGVPRAAAKLGAALVVLGLLVLSVLAIDARAGGEFEPNDTRATAFGPLAGGVSYDGTFETDNDVDWFVFYIKTYSQMDFSATMTEIGQLNRSGSTCSALLRLRDKDGMIMEFDGLLGTEGFAAGGLDETDHLRVTLNPGRYYFEIYRFDGCADGDSYQFQIDPAAAITPSAICGESIVARDAVVPQLAEAEGKLKANAKVLGKAKRNTTRKGKRLRRLKRHDAAEWRIRKARQHFRRAKRSRNTLWNTRKNKLGKLKRQHKQTLVQLDQQIATFC